MRKRAILSCAAALLAIASLWAFRSLGFWLVAEDQAEHASAIFVLAGDTPFRAMEGAALYRQGWAPEVWLAPGGLRRRDLAFAKLGIGYPSELDFNRAVLKHLGVPEPAIRTLDFEVLDTRDEISAASKQLHLAGGNALIIATSQVHTRRVKLLWKALARPDQKLIVRPARQDGFRPWAWWRNTSDILSVAREVAGIINVWLRFPVRTSAN